MCLGFTIASQMVYTLYLFIKAFLYFLSISNTAKSMLGAHSGKLWCKVIPFDGTICPHVLALASQGTINLLRTAMEERKASYGMDENDTT
ncbi:hypothetical protein CFP56_007212 [Quercus suber]|uniref:Uncharacterized protein n=1 Tax=Quercus suber TaxID=58331 RepID=A0AAW0L8D3_QUESU